MTKIAKNVNTVKNAKNGKKLPNKKNKQISQFFYLKIDTWAETAKNGFKCFKMHSNTYSQKKEKNANKW